MRFLGLSKRKRAGLTGDMSPALIAAIVLLGTSLVAGTTEALAQSSPGTATRGVPDAGSSDGIGRAPDATMGDATPAFANTPTPAFASTPTPAFSGTPTPAFSDTQTSPVGIPASTTVENTASGGVAGTMSTGDTMPTNGTGEIAAQGSQTGLPAGRADSAAAVDGPTDRFGQIDANSIGVGSVVEGSGSHRVTNDIGPGFVIVDRRAALSGPVPRPVQFTMICMDSRIQSGCTAPPTFIMEEN
jgi:hypothetical protein